MTIGDIIRNSVALAAAIGFSYFIFALGTGLGIWTRLGLVAASWVLMIIILMGSANGVGATVVVLRNDERK